MTFRTFTISAISALTLATTGAFSDSYSGMTKDQEKLRAISAVEIAKDSPISVTIKPIDVQNTDNFAKGVFQAGDKMAFEVSGVKGAKLYILNMDAKGVIQMIYPNKFTPDHGPLATDILMVPHADAKYQFQASGDGGAELVKFIAIKGDTAAFDAMLEALFNKSEDFPKAIMPAARTTDAFAAFFTATSGADIRETSIDYVVSK